MGIVRLVGRGPMRLSTDAGERDRQRTWTEARVVAEWPVGVCACVVDTEPNSGARQIVPDRAHVHRDSQSEGEDGGASRGIRR